MQVMHITHVLGPGLVVDGCVLHVSLCWVAIHMLFVTYMLQKTLMLDVSTFATCNSCLFNAPGSASSFRSISGMLCSYASAFLLSIRTAPFFCHSCSTCASKLRHTSRSTAYRSKLFYVHC